MSRAAVMGTVWELIRQAALQDKADPAFINCSGAPDVKAVLGNGEDRIALAELGDRVEAHLGPPPPVVLTHAVAVTGAEVCA